MVLPPPCLTIGCCVQGDVWCYFDAKSHNVSSFHKFAVSPTRFVAKSKQDFWLPSCYSSIVKLELCEMFKAWDIVLGPNPALSHSDESLGPFLCLMCDVSIRRSPSRLSVVVKPPGFTALKGGPSISSWRTPPTAVLTE
ncbi:hypothetical protein XENOCAPTIV_001530 [Xenoophorus captivus]|uniref:Uncharacterized protein n=1 Tax=Xenoophorus captivus TaxID=1517983 RepID=A0ABV0RTC3_9TELE